MLHSNVARPPRVPSFSQGKAKSVNTLSIAGMLHSALNSRLVISALHCITIQTSSLVIADRIIVEVRHP